MVMSEYAKRILPHVELHKLEGEGHYSWFFSCDRCQRELLTTLFGEVAGLDNLEEETTTAKEEEPVHEYFEQGPEKPEEGPLNDLAIAEAEAEKIALFKEVGQIPPIEPSIGISPEQYEELQHIKEEKEAEKEVLHETQTEEAKHEEL